MNQYQIIWQISSNANGNRSDLIVGIVIGVVFVFIGVLGALIKQRTNWKLSERSLSPNFMILFGVLWLFISVSFALGGFGDCKKLNTIFTNKKYSVVEGIVHVSHEQLFHGHSKGDIVEIGGKKFEVNYFAATSGYKQTISHGGALQEGVYARIKYYDEHILSVEIKSESMKPF